MGPASVDPGILSPLCLELRLLAAGFQYPDAAWRARFGSLFEHVRKARALPESDADILESCLAREEPADLEAEHFRLFGSAPACSLDLAHYMSENPFEQPKRLADLAGFYAAFGVECIERADSLPALLELAALLELKRANAEAKGWAEKAELSRSALAQLGAALAPALRAFLRRLEGCRPPEFYARLARRCVGLLGGNP